MSIGVRCWRPSAWAEMMGFGAKDYVVRPGKTRRKPRKKPKPRKFLGPEEKAELRRLRAEGWSVQKLSVHFGVSFTTAWRIANADR